MKFAPFHQLETMPLFPRSVRESTTSRTSLVALALMGIVALSASGAAWALHRSSVVAAHGGDVQFGAATEAPLTDARVSLVVGARPATLDPPSNVRKASAREPAPPTTGSERAVAVPAAKRVAPPSDSKPRMAEKPAEKSADNVATADERRPPPAVSVDAILQQQLKSAIP